MTKSKDLVTVSGGLSVPADLVEFYKENAGVGSENLAGSIPQLKVTESNSQNEGVDGQYVPAGQFFYSPTRESFTEARVSIMAISRGFYAMDNQKEPKPKFTQLLGGMMLDSMQPFVMFVSGTRLQNMWNFGKEIKPFTKQVPMFSFEVELGLNKVKTDFGTNHVVTYSITRDGKGQIQLIGDRELLNMLRNGVESVQDMFDSFIEQKEVDRNTGELLKDKAVTETFNAVAQAQDPDQVEETMPEPTEEELNSNQAKDVADDIPF